MYRLEYRYLTDTSDWQAFFKHTLEREEAISMLRSAQIADTRDNIERVWRVSPNPWEAGE